MSTSIVLMTSYSSTKALSWDYGLRYTRVGERQIYLMAEVILSKAVEVAKLNFVISTLSQAQSW